jgi:hypothetical protein
MIWAGVQLALIVFFVPETYHPVLLRQKAVKLRKDSKEERWIAPIERMDRSIARTVLWSCIRPFQLLVLEPMVGRFHHIIRDGNMTRCRHPWYAFACCNDADGKSA